MTLLTIAATAFVAALLVSFLPNSLLFILIKILLMVAVGGSIFFYVKEDTTAGAVDPPPAASPQSTRPRRAHRGEGMAENTPIKTEHTVEAYFDLFLETIFPLIKRTLVADTVVLLMVNYFRKAFYIRYRVTEYPELMLDPPFFDLPRGLTALILKERKALLENALPDSEDLLPYYREGSNPARSFLGVPIFFDDYVAGILCVDSRVEGSFSDEDLQILGEFARIVGIQLASSNKQYENEAENTANRQLTEFTGELLSLTDMNALSGYLQNRLAEIFAADRVTICERSGKNNGRVLAISDDSGPASPGSQFPDNGGVFGWVLRKNQTLLVEDFSEKENYIPRLYSDEAPDNSFKALLAAPLTLENRAEGVIALESRSSRAFSESQKKMLEAMAARVAALLGNIRSTSRLKALTLLDPATGIGNPQAFEMELTKEIGRSMTFERGFALQCLEVSVPGESTDPAMQERLASEFVSFVLPLLKEAGYIFRLAQERYAIIWPEKSARAASGNFAELLEQIVARKPWADGVVEHIALSSGFVQYPQMAEAAGELLEKAGAALTAALEKGPNNFEIYRETANIKAEGE